MSETNDPGPGLESLVDLGKRLTAALERPEALSIGAFAAMVERLHAELSMIGDPAALSGGSGALSNDDLALLLGERAPLRVLSEGELDALGSFLAQS